MLQLEWTEAKGNTFTVGVLCANPAANSVQSEASDAWPIFASTTGASGSGSGQPTTTTVPVPVLCETIASLSSVGASEVSQKFADQLRAAGNNSLVAMCGRSQCPIEDKLAISIHWLDLIGGSWFGGFLSFAQHASLPSFHPCFLAAINSGQFWRMEGHSWTQ